MRPSYGAYFAIAVGIAVALLVGHKSAASQSPAKVHSGVPSHAGNVTSHSKNTMQLEHT